MNRATGVAAAALCLSTLLLGQSESGRRKEPPVTQSAKGTFDVKLQPQAVADQNAGLQRFSLEKQFHGDLEGSSKGEMLSAGNPATGFGGYVAIERVTGTLTGRSGSFVLQHNGTMNAGKTQLSVTVVPGSGTGQLAGIGGKMNIIIEGGKHFYDFEYTLPVQP